MSAWRAFRGAGMLAVALALSAGARPALSQPSAATLLADNREATGSDSASVEPRPAVTAAADVQTLADSLWHLVSAHRGLRADGSVPVEVVDAQRVADRAAALTAEETGNETAAAVLQYLGIAPSDASHCMQDGGFYDVDARVLLLANGLDPQATRSVLVRSLVGALQDQHFALRVRRKLGFENRDARAAWHALLCGDAELVASEIAAAESASTATLSPSAAFVSALRARGGWRRVDAAYVQLPASTEQILHPERYLDELDAPVRVELPDIRGFLGAAFAPVGSARLGERDLALYFLQHVDSTLALEAAAGWGGTQAVLYGEPGRDAQTLVVGSVWDSETDAVEAYDAFMRCLAARYTDAKAIRETSTAELAVWGAAKPGTVHALQLRGRLVIALENVPATSLARILNKIDHEQQLDDPTPDIRAQDKADLPWNRVAAETDSTRTLRVDLPAAWAQDSEPPDTLTAAGFEDKVVLAARRGAASLCVAIDPEAQDPLGAGGFAHSLARRLQSQGHGVYIRRDEPSRKLGGAYEHVFLQHEGDSDAGEHDVVYSIAVVPLAQGFGLIILREPSDTEAQPRTTDFAAILDGVRLIQEDANPKLASEPLTPSAPRN